MREAAVHVDRLSQAPHLPKVIFSVSDSVKGFASDLRGYTMARELRRFGWRTLVFPPQLELVQRQRLVRRERPDIVVLQKARHRLNRPEFYPDTKCVLDIDDSYFLVPGQDEGIVQCMEQCERVICGSRYLADYARQYNGAVDIIWTGSRPRPPPGTKKASPPVVAWAVSSVSDYLPELTLVMSALELVERTDWQFWLFGEADTARGVRLTRPLESRGIPVRIFPFLDFDQFLSTLEEVSIGLAPLVPDQTRIGMGKSFGKILHYLNCRVAVVASDAADHPLFFENGVNGFLATSAREFAQRIDLLIAREDLRETVVQRAHRDYLDRLSIHSAARKMDGVLRSVLVQRAGPVLRAAAK